MTGWWDAIQAWGPFRWWHRWDDKVAAEEAAASPDTEIGLEEW